MPFTIALDRCADDARPYIENAVPSHPSVIDTEHVVAELYHVTNVPTMVWIDENGRVCRPNDAQFGTDTFTQFHGKHSEPYLEMIRAWVRGGSGALAPEETRKLQALPTDESQLARAERALAWHLHQGGRTEAAERHFDRAGELAPLDWTIRGVNPMGPDFFALAQEGKPEYPMEARTAAEQEVEGA